MSLMSVCDKCHKIVKTEELENIVFPVPNTHPLAIMVERVREIKSKFIMDICPQCANDYLDEIKEIWNA